MWFHFAFTSPDEAGLHRRRQLLDAYGQAAQLSALILLLAYRVPDLFQFLKTKFGLSQSQSKRKEHTSPVVARFGEDPIEIREGRSSIWSRLAWSLDQEISPGWGTWRVLLIAAIWTIWLLVLAIKDTGDDYLHLTKRFGIIAASQLPLHYLLALKSSYSPITLLTRLSHEELNPYHRALGRILLLIFSLHASFYLNFYIQKSLLLKRVRDRDVILGLLAITTFLTVGTSALAKIRQRNYFLFFVVHVTLSISILPTLYFHVSHLRVFILESAVIYLFLILQRNISQSKTPSSTLTRLPSTNPTLISIIIPFTPSLYKPTFHPGQHIYLSLPTPLTAPHEKLRLNPFTVANLPHKDGHIRLVLRALNGTTSLLSTLASKSPTPMIPLLIEGPYGAASNFPNLLSFDKILLVAGGVGATFTIPIYRDLVDRGIRPQRVRFVWSVKTLVDARWASDYLQEGSEIYVTGSQPPAIKSMRKTSHVGRGEAHEIELQERVGLMDDTEGEEEGADGDGDGDVDMPAHSTLFNARPNFHRVVNEIFTATPAPSKVAVLVCGPGGMGAALRREVDVWVFQGREVWWHNEEFGW